MDNGGQRILAFQNKTSNDMFCFIFLSFSIYSQRLPPDQSAPGIRWFQVSELSKHAVQHQLCFLSVCCPWLKGHMNIGEGGGGYKSMCTCHKEIPAYVCAPTEWGTQIMNGKSTEEKQQKNKNILILTHHWQVKSKKKVQLPARKTELCQPLCCTTAALTKNTIMWRIAWEFCSRQHDMVETTIQEQAVPLTSKINISPSSENTEEPCLNPKCLHSSEGRDEVKVPGHSGRAAGFPFSSPYLISLLSLSLPINSNKTFIASTSGSKPIGIDNNPVRCYCEYMHFPDPVYNNLLVAFNLQEH